MGVPGEVVGEFAFAVEVEGWVVGFDGRGGRGGLDFAQDCGIDFFSI